MSRLGVERLQAIDEVLAQVVKPARWPRTAPVQITANHLRGEPVSYAVAIDGAFEPFAVGERWGPLWDTTWFHITGSVPQEWAGDDCVLVVHLGYGGGTGFGAEGQVWVKGEPTQGISPNHREIPVAASASGGEAIDLYIEAAANPPAPAADPGPLLAADPLGEPQLVLRRCHLAVVDRNVETLVRDWSLVRDLVAWVGGDRADRCAEVLDHACVVVEEGIRSDSAAEGGEVSSGSVAERRGITPDSVAEARELLREVLDRRGPDSPDRPRHLAVGNSHLDTAWLWPLRETRRKAARTFSTAATLLESESDYRFAASQPQQFEWIRDDYPALWGRIREHAAQGHFEVVGSMWVEPDCNVPSGESLVRQLVHGKRFFREEFGVDTDGLWLPDVFGYSAALPQILEQAGVDWFLTQKMSWNDTNRFPHHTFWWEGIDGTRIFTHFRPADTYSGDFSVASLRHSARNFAQREIRRNSMYLYGHGDGGGGPEKDMLEQARRLRDLDGVGLVELTSATDAMARLRSEGSDAGLPAWVGELYLELHRGTFTTQAAVKAGNRELELALRDAELWAWAANNIEPGRVATEGLDRAWKTLLLHQFHDIIPGSSIHWVYEDTLADYADVRTTTSAIIGASVAAIAGRIDVDGYEQPALVVNALPWERDEVVEVAGALHRVRAPACGWSMVDLTDSPRPADPVVPTNGSDLDDSRRPSDEAVTSGDGWMQNGHLRVEWDDAGLLGSVRHLATGREAISPGAVGNVLQLMDDQPKEWDAWDIDREAFDSAIDLTSVEHLELVEQTTLRTTLLVVRAFGDSRIEQRIQLLAGGRRVEVHCRVDWHENHKLLKVAFPLDVRAMTARHEIQFGHVERPTHQNTSWDVARFETCAHTWVDLSEEGFGVALLNDCKYGHDVAGNVVRLSLLRSPTWPDPIADRGEHRFAYALYPHAGSPTSGGVIEEAHSFNSALRVHPVASRPAERSSVLPSCHSLVEVDAPGVVISAMKAADDGEGSIIRLYEAYGGRRRVGLRVPGTESVERVDLLEEPRDGDPIDLIDGVICLDLRPFELITLRLR